MRLRARGFTAAAVALALGGGGAPAAAVAQDSPEVVLRVEGPRQEIVLDFRDYTPRQYRQRVAGTLLQVECTKRLTSGSGFSGSEDTFEAPRGRRLVRTGSSARGQDYCVARILTYGSRPVASRAFTAFGRAELGEWATVESLIGLASFVLELREDIDRYPTTEELGGFGLTPIPAPDAPLPASAIGVFIDPAVDRVHVTQVSQPSNRRLFFEFTGRGRDITVSTNAPGALFRDL